MDGSYEVRNDFRQDLDQVAAMVGLHLGVGPRRRRPPAGPGRLRRPSPLLPGGGRVLAAGLPGARAGDADVVIANAYPIDVSLTFMRSKGVTPLLLAKPGASRVLVSACSEGGGYLRAVPVCGAPSPPSLLHLARTVSARPGAVPAKAAAACGRRCARGGSGGRRPRAASPSGCTSPVGRRSTCRPRSRG